MLRTRQLIPPFTARTHVGKTLRAWDYNQKKNLVIAFLIADSPHSGNFVELLAARAADLRERNALALVIFSDAPPAALRDSLPGEILIAADMSGRSARAYLGDDAFGPTGQQRSGVFVADRYGELFAQWVAPDAAALPGAGEILSALGQIEVACEECGVSHWPAEE